MIDYEHHPPKVLVFTKINHTILIFWYDMYNDIELYCNPLQKI